MNPKPVSRIKVGLTHYEVVRRPSPITEGEGTNVFGRVLYNSGQLVIANHLAPEVEVLMILHEVFHAMMFHCGIKQHDETFVETASGYLLDLIRDNPKLIAAIQATKQ